MHRLDGEPRGVRNGVLALARRREPANGRSLLIGVEGVKVQPGKRRQVECAPDPIRAHRSLPVAESAEWQSACGTELVLHHPAP